jgi:hypothetical protein
MWKGRGTENAPAFILSWTNKDIASPVRFADTLSNPEIFTIVCRLVGEGFLVEGRQPLYVRLFPYTNSSSVYKALRIVASLCVYGKGEEEKVG